MDVQSPLLKASELKSVKDIFGQIINLQGEKKYRENLRNTDVLIKVDVTGYSAASFTKEAIDTLMVRGERAAMDSWDGLLALKQKLGLADDYQPRRPGPFRLPGAAVDREIPVDSQIAAPAVRENKLNVGFRFDTEELAALQANTDFYFGRSGSRWPASPPVWASVHWHDSDIVISGTVDGRQDLPISSTIKI